MTTDPTKAAKGRIAASSPPPPSTPAPPAPVPQPVQGTQGQAWQYDGGDADTLVNQGGTQDAPNGGIYGHILNINSDGSVDVGTTDGRDMTIKAWNGKPVTKWVRTVQRAVPGTHGEGNMPVQGEGAYDTQAPGPRIQGKQMPNKSTNMVEGHWELNSDALPNLRTSKSADGKTDIQWFDLEPQGYKQNPKNPAKIGDVIQGYAQQQNSKDPKLVQDTENIKDQLYKAGYTSGVKLPKGIWTADATKALDAALGDAAANGTTLEDALQKQIAANPNGPPGSGQVIATTNPQDIIDSVRNQAADILGYVPDDNTVNGLVQKYQQAEIDTQTAKNGVSGPNGSGITGITSLPTVDDYVHDQLVQSNPLASQGMAMGHHLAEFVNLLGSGATPSSSTFGK